MAFKYFTNAVEGHVDETLAINPNHIVNVYERETIVATKEGNKEKKVTILFAGPVGSWEVKEDYLTVVARLNERD
jgi:cobalamin biosynthesis Co2+ chelatase CbiK